MHDQNDVNQDHRLSVVILYWVRPANVQLIFDTLVNFDESTTLPSSCVILAQCLTIPIPKYDRLSTIPCLMSGV